MTTLCLPAAPGPSQRLGWFALIGLCLFSALLGRLCFLIRPFDNDAGIFIYEGKMVAEGGRLGHDIVDNKFPTVGLLTSAAWRVFTNHWFAYIALQTSLAFISAALLGGMASRHTGRHAFWPAALFALVFLNITFVVFGGFQLETLLVFFVVLAARSALMAIESDSPADSFLAGLCAGCAAMLKPTGVAVLVALAIGLMVQSRKPRRMLGHLFAVGAGLAIPLTVSLVYLVQTHLLAEMPALWGQITQYASQSVWLAEDWNKPLIAALLLGFPLLVQGWICRRQRDPASGWPIAPVLLFAVAWLALESTGVLMQRRMYQYHFLPVIPPAALLMGLFPRRPRATFLAAALLPAIVLSVYQASWVLRRFAGYQSIAPQSRYLLAHAKPGDAIWMEGWPRIALETNLHPGARVPVALIFTNTDRAPLEFAQQMLGDFGRLKPKYILLPAPLDQRVIGQADSIPELKFRPQRRENYIKAWNEIRDYTLAHYVRETEVDGQTVYRRSSESRPAYTAAPSE